MEYIIAKATAGECFTVGKCYPVLDGSFERGIYTTDDDNIDHYLSPEYLLHNFLTDTIIITKKGRKYQQKG